VKHLITATATATATTTTDNRQQTTGNRQQATGNRQQATGNRQQTITYPNQSLFLPKTLKRVMSVWRRMKSYPDFIRWRIKKGKAFHPFAEVESRKKVRKAERFDDPSKKGVVCNSRKASVFPALQTPARLNRTKRNSFFGWAYRVRRSPSLRLLPP